MAIQGRGRGKPTWPLPGKQQVEPQLNVRKAVATKEIAGQSVSMSEIHSLFHQALRPLLSCLLLHRHRIAPNAVQTVVSSTVPFERTLIGGG